MTGPKVVVLDHGYGNVLSVAHALERAGARVSLSVDAAEVAQADGLVVPGVGAFAAVMRSLQASRAPLMIERRLAGGRPVLGICVGLQVMFTSGDENGEVTAGLDQWPSRSCWRASTERDSVSYTLMLASATPLRPWEWMRNHDGCSAPRSCLGHITEPTLWRPWKTEPCAPPNFTRKSPDQPGLACSQTG